MLTTIALPLAKPGVIVVGMFLLLSSWDEYLFTSTLVQADTGRTVAVGLVTQYIGLYSYSWDKIMAMSVILSVPMAILFLFFGTVLYSRPHCRPFEMK